MTDWSEVSKKLGAQYQSQNKISWTEGAARSALWSIPGLIGVDPPDDLQRWQAENPGSAFTSEMLATLPTYGAWLKGARNIPKIAKAAGKAEDAFKLPFLKGAAREAVYWAPFEGGRLALGAAAGEEIAKGLGSSYQGTGELLGETAFGMGVGSVLGGTFDTLRSVGKTLKKTPSTPGVDIDAPVQLQIRQLRENLTAGKIDPEFLPEAQGRLTELAAQARAEKGVKYSGESDINRLFRVGGTKGIRREPLIVNSKLSQGKLKTIEEKVGFTEGFEADVRFPRVISISDKSATTQIRRVLGKMDKVEEGTWLKREGEEGLFTLVKKIEGGKKFEAGDQFVAFQTDQPGKFLPGHAKFANLQSSRAAWYAGKKTETPIGNMIYDEGVNVKGGISVEDLRGLEDSKGNLVKLTDSFMEKTGLGKVADETGELRRTTGQFVRSYVAPAMFQFSHPLARRAFVTARSTFEKAQGIAEERLLGARRLDTSNIYKAVVKGGADFDPNSPFALMEKVAKDKVQWGKFLNAVEERMTIADAADQLGLNPDTIALMKSLKKLDDILTSETQQIETVVKGKPTFAPLENHYGLSRTWKGDWRVPVYDESGRLRYVGAGTRAEALASADQAVNQAKEIGRTWKPGSPSLGDWEYDSKLLREFTKSPKGLPDGRAPVTFQQRTGVKGYINTEMSLADAKEILTRNVKQRHRYMARLTVDDLLSKDIDRLMLDNPAEAEQIVKRIQQLSGEQGDIEKWLNKHLDPILGPVLGKESAGKIVGGLNRFMFWTTLGFFNTGYNMANLLSFAQTAFPMMSLLHSIPTERARQYFQYFPIDGPNGQHVVGSLNVFKIAGQSFKEMGNPSPQLQKAIFRAAEDGVWAPRFVEEMIGQNAHTAANLRGIFSGDQPITGGLKFIAEAVPATTEKFARAQSFTMGYIYGRDVLGVVDEDKLYRFAKEFTEKTQYLYSTADRANIITGPLGSAFGLFKNWMMHYIGWWMMYAQEGVKYGNWKPFLWANASTGVLGGIGGLGPLTYMADRASEWMSDESLMFNTYEMFGPEAADIVYFGLPSMLGFSLQAQMQAPFTDPGRDAGYMFSLAYTQTAKNLSRTFGAALDSWQATGEVPLKDGDVVRGLFRSLAPKNIYRMTQLSGNQILSSSTGNPNVDGLGPGAKAMFMMGLNPTQVERNYAVAGELWRNEKARKEKIAAFGDAWADAKEGKDYREARMVLSRAAAQGLSVDSVIKSGLIRLSKNEEALLDRQFSEESVLPYQRIGMVK